MLANYWLWFPDDCFIVNRNTLEKLPLFLKCFNNSTFFNVVCISWTTKVFDTNDMYTSFESLGRNLGSGIFS